MPRSLAALFVALIAPMAGAADFSDPDWPCIQRKQPHLSLAQVWSGPVPDAAAEDLARSAAIQALAEVLGRAIPTMLTPRDPAVVAATPAGAN